VPVILAGQNIDKSNTHLNPGKLADVAPTILELMNVEQPSEMTGFSLIKK
jgi:2,3-bisphosphoglycerate-independent phosphoglycerate mutase